MIAHCAYQFLQCTSTLYICHVIAKKNEEYERFPTCAVVDRFTITEGIGVVYLP